MDQPPLAEDPSRVVRTLDRLRRASPERRRAVALAGAATTTALLVAGLLLWRVYGPKSPIAEAPVEAAAGGSLSDILDDFRL